MRRNFEWKCLFIICKIATLNMKVYKLSQNIVVPKQFYIEFIKWIDELNYKQFDKLEVQA